MTMLQSWETVHVIHVFKVRPHLPRHAPTNCPTATLMTSPCVPVPTTRPGQPTIAENSVDMSCVHVRFHGSHINTYHNNYKFVAQFKQFFTRSSSNLLTVYMGTIYRPSSISSQLTIVTLGLWSFIRSS